MNPFSCAALSIVVLASALGSARSLAQAPRPTAGDLQSKVLPGDTLEGARAAAGTAGEPSPAGPVQAFEFGVSAG